MISWISNASVGVKVALAPALAIVCLLLLFRVVGHLPARAAVRRSLTA